MSLHQHTELEQICILLFNTEVGNRKQSLKRSHWQAEPEIMLFVGAPVGVVPFATFVNGSAGAKYVNADGLW